MNYIENYHKVKKENDKKEMFINLIGLIVLAGLLLVNGIYNGQQITSVASYQPHIAEEVLRFHVIANSDSEEDQNLKLKVKEAVLQCVRPMLSDAKTKEEAEKIITQNMTEIEIAANEIIAKEGFSYTSKGVLGKTTFPMKQYGDMVFPAGEYEAFRILIGEAKGKNWWCVMFPTLCFVDETYDVITEENKEQFREILSEEEYESLLQSMKALSNNSKLENKNQNNRENKVFYKLKSAVWLNKVIDYLRK